MKADSLMMLIKFTVSSPMQFNLTRRGSIFLNLAALLFISGCNPSENESASLRSSSETGQQDLSVSHSEQIKASKPNHLHDTSDQDNDINADEGNRNPEKSNLTAANRPPLQTTSNNEQIPAASEALKIEQIQESVIDSLDAGDLDRAWESIRLASRIDSDNFDTRYLRARVLAERNRFAEAVKQLDQLASEDPNIVLPVLGQTAEWLTYDGRWEAAEDRFRQLIDLAPQIGMAHRKLAELLIRQGKRIEACKYFAALCEVGNIEEVELRQLLRISSAFSGTESADEQTPIGPLGLAHFQYAEGNLQDTLMILQNQKTTSPEINALVGRLHAINRDEEQLAAWAKRNTQQNNSFSGFWFAQGVHAQNSENHALAIDCFCRAVLIDPTDADAYQRLSESLMADQQIESAKIAATRATQLTETHAIGQEFTSNQAREPAQIAKLCELLQQLQRPYESLAWQAVGLIYNQQALGLSNQEITSQLQVINQKRTELIKTGEKWPAESFILCGAKTSPRK